MSDTVDRPQPALPPRLESVDLLRGLVMVIMALDHARDFFHRDALRFDPTDLSKTTAALFLTRWITHLCAPVFVFLAGTGAFLSLGRGRTPADLSRFLLTRGLWLVILEHTVVRFAWFFNLDYRWMNAQVIWALGWSMVVLAAWVRLPVAASALLGVAMIAGHNLLDGLSPAGFGALGWLWTVLHVQAPLQPAPGHTFFVLYPLVPWIGVMAAGYAFGSVLSLPTKERRRRLLLFGLGLTAAFVVLRAINLYGDPQPWSVQRDGPFTFFSFINCQKYPPSLLFLLMTLGPSIALLAWFDRSAPAVLRPLVVFGRVPLFYYVLHLMLIHLLAVVFAIIRYGPRVAEVLAKGIPADYGYGLGVVYAVWIGAVVGLYPACRWFASVKARRRSAWLSYL